MAGEGSTGPEPVSVLFVCLGNICRSTMAEGVFRSITSHPSHPLIAEVDSAGTGGYHIGASPDSRTMRTLKKNKITDYKHAARQVHVEDFEEYDWIFGMDADNVEDLKSMQRRANSRKKRSGTQSENGKEPKIMLFGEFGGRKGEEINDPYYGADNGFDIAYEQAVRFSKGFLEHLESASKKE